MCEAEVHVALILEEEKMYINIDIKKQHTHRFSISQSLRKEKWKKANPKWQTRVFPDL